MKLQLLKQVCSKSLLILMVCLFTGQLSATAISPEQKRVLRNGNHLFDLEVNTGCTPGGSVGEISNTLPATIPAGYANLFNQAAAAYKINPQFLAALFLNEHSNTWLPFDGPWASSPVGASGPFQFMPGTWNAYKVDGNNDGVVDIQNIYDSAFAAANMASKNGMTTTTPLGSLEKPFTPQTFLYFSAAYNWGSGNVQKKTDPNSPITAAPEETENYVTNTYLLISSGFTQGSPKNGPIEDKSNGQTSTTSGSGATTAGDGCSSGVVAGSIVETALNFAWDTRGHGVNKEDAKPTYQVAMPQYNGATHTTPYSDCGVFVSTVMIASGADVDFPKRITDVQLDYMESSPKYTEIVTTNSADLLPGDIFVNNSHTYMYVGPQPGGYSIVAASLGDHVPEAGYNAYFSERGEKYRIFRLKG